MLPMFQLLRMSNCDATRSHPIPQTISHHHLLRPKDSTFIRYWLFVGLLTTLLLVSCGPENSGSSQETLAKTTHQIALEYQIHHDLTQATAALEALDVANLNQWLLYVTEAAITSNTDVNLINALVLLSTDIGLQSNSIHQYVLQHNLVEAAVALQPEVIINPQPTPEVVATVAQSEVGNVPDNSAATAEPSSEKASVESTPAILSADVSTTTAELPVAVILTPTLTPTPDVGAQIKAISDINVRLGPGTDYPIASGLSQSATATITGKNSGGDWWEVLLPDGQRGWVYAPLVETAGDTNAVAVAVNIPTPPPTATPAPTQPPAPPTEVPAAEPAATEVPAPVVDPNGTPHFTLVSRRLWGKAENDGCIGKHLLRIHVLDANGVRINGVRLRGIYTNFEVATGDQGKGDGIIEFDLHGSGEGFMVIRNDDGREATSDRAEGFTTRSIDIDQATLIATGYCTNDEDCKIFYDSWGCHGHHSWEATFQRNY